ncbi:MAG: DUF5686 family protein [Bacteroidales bacterium]|nr:DUF5686 family protein [Bacteroidales bacterium]
MSTVKKTICLLLLLSFSMLSFAEDIIVIGQVVSANDMRPLENVNVWFQKNSRIGTITNNEGYFMLRAPERQDAVVVSLVGYRRVTVKLDQTKRDQVVNVALEEKVGMLSELTVTPGGNPANDLLKEVRKHKADNNYRTFTNLSYVQTTQNKFYLTNLKQKMFQRKLFRELQDGTLSTEDSTVIMPMHYSLQVEAVNNQETDKTIKLLSSEQYTTSLLSTQYIEAVMQDLTSEVNFYDNNIPLMGRSFVSPLSNQGKSFYEFYLIDSVCNDSVTTTKEYVVTFTPKSDKSLAFKGVMRIDARSYALTFIDATMPPTANINYINNIHLCQKFTKIDSLHYVPVQMNHGLGMQLFHSDTAKHYFAAIMDSQTQFDSIHTFGKTIGYVPVEHIDTTHQNFVQAIEKADNSKLMRLANYAVYVVNTGYIPAGPIEFGPFTEFFRFDQIQGFRPTLSLRTSEKMCQWFSIGGYAGYGIRNKHWNYGGDLKFRFGSNFAHSISASYYDDYYRIDNQRTYVGIDQYVDRGENLFNVGRFNQLFHQRIARLNYSYDAAPFKLFVEGNYHRYFGGDSLPLVGAVSGKPLDYMNVQTVRVGFRYAPKEKSIDYFFHHHHLTSHKPVVSFLATVGHYNTTEKQGQYAALSLGIIQFLHTSVGELRYSVSGNYLFGDVPYTQLFTPRTQSGRWFNCLRFNSLNHSLYLSDAMLEVHANYYTNGWIFNHIPGVKILNLREEFFVKAAWGGLRSGHANILEMPNQNTLRIPYVEAGVGISNILSLFTVEFVWRLTHRQDMPEENFGVKFKIQPSL